MHKGFSSCCGLYQWNLPHALGRKSSPSPSRATCKTHTGTAEHHLALHHREKKHSNNVCWCPEYGSGEDLPGLMGFPAATLRVREWPQLAGRVISDADSRLRWVSSCTNRKYRTPGSDFCSASPQQHGFCGKMSFCHWVFKNQATRLPTNRAHRHTRKNEQDPGSVAN